MSFVCNSVYIVMKPYSFETVFLYLPAPIPCNNTSGTPSFVLSVCLLQIIVLICFVPFDMLTNLPSNEDHKSKVHSICSTQGVYQYQCIKKAGQIRNPNSFMICISIHMFRKNWFLASSLGGKWTQDSLSHMSESA